MWVKTIARYTAHTRRDVRTTELYPCGEVVAEFELLQECRHEDGRKKEKDTPEEDVRDIWSMWATGTAHKLPSLLHAVL